MLKGCCVWTTVALCVSVSQAATAHSTKPVAEVEGLQMFSDFWLNLHHFLYVSAWARRPDVPGQRRLAYTTVVPRVHIIVASADTTYAGWAGTQPYLYATGLVTTAWPMFRKPVEQTVGPFVDRKINLAEMARTLAASAP